jgi:ribosome maturation factor RimP
VNLQESISELVESVGVKLYDIERVKDGDNQIFRVYITSKDGINLDKCAEVSNLISPLLDVEEPLFDKYFFEVSSPGIERKLKKLSHYEASIGESIEIKLEDGSKLEGELTSADRESIELNSKRILLSDIKSAKTIFKW